MAKNASSKATPAPSPAAGQQPAGLTANVTVDAAALKSLVTDAERQLDATEGDRPTPEQFADQLKSPADLQLLRDTLRIAEERAAAGTLDEGELVRVYHLNRSGGSFIHGPYRLDPNGHCDVPQSVADLWISHKVGGHDVVGLRKDEGPAPATVALKAKNDELGKENADLAGRVKALEKLLEAAKGGATPPAATE